MQLPSQAVMCIAEVGRGWTEMFAPISLLYLKFKMFWHRETYEFYRISIIYVSQQNIKATAGFPTLKNAAVTQHLQRSLKE